MNLLPHGSYAVANHTTLAVASRHSQRMAIGGGSVIADRRTAAFLQRQHSVRRPSAAFKNKLTAMRRGGVVYPCGCSQNGAQGHAVRARAIDPRSLNNASHSPVLIDGTS